VIGLAKARSGEEGAAREFERVFLPGLEEPVILDPGSATTHLVARVRDEAHRFAITYHRKLRDKRAISSELDEIPGIGEARKKALLRRFGSVEKIGQATAEEMAAILKKCASFHPSAKAIQSMAGKVGAFIETNEEELSALVRAEEKAPASTKSLVVSMDGVNVLLREPGPRRGRPKERPEGQTEEETTLYRNAMVGSVSLYGEVPPEEEAPERLQSRYASHMPQEKAATFKRRFEEEGVVRLGLPSHTASRRPPAGGLTVSAPKGLPPSHAAASDSWITSSRVP